MPYPTSCWSEFPVDLIINTMGFMMPHEILVLRKVSQSIAHITRERSVWIDALRRLSLKHGIYTPSFPLTAMTLDELEHAATACRRFSARLRHKFIQPNDSLLSPIASQFIEATRPGEDFDHLRFLPGGRFLVTTFGCTLRLWDLGTTPTNAKLNPIASFELEGVTDIQSVRTRASNSSSEALLIVSTTESQSVFRVYIFTIYPPASNPKFTLFAPILTLPMDGRYPNIIGATSQHVSISTASSMVIWDFIADSWSSWPSKPSLHDKGCDPRQPLFLS
ncbi:hypothetical protein DFH07DRAFT_7929 [Mycena maculata]|uniref:F-box domain-containing protein n=1 Tax=Mycena maculata TaxID=230809 RepID=A0AAD7KHV4_9AGAR|nr:hypothetical protein DFH07DRAFT_7929 [Mycena maculata]